MDVPWENLQKYFQPSVRFIKEAIESGGSVFVHCYAGMSRSATIVVAYLMSEHNFEMY